ncbi:MAG: 50S ribosomal protein L11 methyltransferase, partial [Bacteroidota bacterium]
FKLQIMIYHSYTFFCTPNQSEILIAILSENNFEGFQEEENSLTAYISSEEKIAEVLIQQVESFGIKFPSPEIIPDKNWNEEWESKITPIEIYDLVLVRTEFHPVEKKFPFEIIIQPKMSFGTGHHATTHMMIELMLENKNDFKDAAVFDFGAGTGILSIMAGQLGAKEILSIDNEDWAYENMIENFARNNSTHCIPQLANQPPATENKFDIILANINRNVILEFLPALKQTLKPLGIIFCSGFLPEDEIVIMQAAEKLNLKFSARKFRENWMVLVFKNTN